ncbi:hypothetical protein PR048_021823 [Dryococelus australis]|uniref:Uncharacterized protein n=1 Tax=Dryococelus australis TaxID=614101 RepID=A0ABQ9GZ88_9NEOP|nr:hypothetical protein PR048_021823 [Dryococelus australis]
MIEPYDVKQRRPRKEEGSIVNSKSFRYLVIVEVTRMQVCLKAVLSLHVIAIKRVKLLEGFLVAGKNRKDQRGKNAIKNALTTCTRTMIREHFKSFPAKQKKHPDFPHENFSLSFGSPQINTCGVCEELNTKTKSLPPESHCKKICRN